MSIRDDAIEAATVAIIKQRGLGCFDGQSAPVAHAALDAALPVLLAPLRELATALEDEADEANMAPSSDLMKAANRLRRVLDRIEGDR